MLRGKKGSRGSIISQAPVACFAAPLKVRGNRWGSARQDLQLAVIVACDGLSAGPFPWLCMFDFLVEALIGVDKQPEDSSDGGQQSREIKGTVPPEACREDGGQNR